MLTLNNVLHLPTLLLRRGFRRSRLATMLLALSITCLFLLPFYIIYKPPSVLIHYFSRRWPDILWEIDTKAKIIALTIDDAPSPYTLEILDVLRLNGATATFFVIGAQAADVEAGKILANVVRQGSELGNHAMRDEPSKDLTDDQLRTQLFSVQSIIRRAYTSAGQAMPPLYFRPGSGFFHDRMRKLVNGLGYKLVLGGIYPHDPQIKFAWLNARHILSMVRPGGVVICHDRRSWTLPMLRIVLPELASRGYVVRSLTGAVALAKEKENG